MSADTDRFEQEAWSLFILFDSYEVQAQAGMEHPLGEKAATEAYVLEDSGMMPEELAQVCRHHDDGRLEITCEVVDWLSRVIEWVLFNTVPQKLELVRNHDRS